MAPITTQSASAESLPNQSSISVVRYNCLSDRSRAESFALRSSPNDSAFWLGSAAVGGILCGVLFFSTLSFWHRDSVSSSSVLQGPPISRTVVAVPYPTAGGKSSAERKLFRRSSLDDFSSALEEVRIRNRRLEALVKVLRQRDEIDRQTLSVSHKN